MEKIFLTIDEQISLLKTRRMYFNDISEKIAREALNEFGRL